jgi:uncharacterized tellurite resistance protein B-like protein
VASRTELISDLLMAAAHADPLQEQTPYEVVRKALQQVMGAGYILTTIDERLKAFDNAAFDLSATVEALALSDDAEKRQLVELIAAVHAADDVLAEEEDAYLRKVAEALGLPDDAYADLTLDIMEARDSLDDVRESLFEARNSLFGPPPAPKPPTVPPPLPKN